MKTRTILFLTCLGILLLLFINTSQKPIAIGKIEKMESTEITTIYLENSQTPIILFEEPTTSFKEEDKIIIFGKMEKWKNSPQIIAEKIIKK